MRILHVNKFGHVVGGVETHIAQLTRLQDAAGDTTDLFSADDFAGGGFDAEGHSLHSKVSTLKTLLWSSEARDQMASRLRSFEPDVVHFHGVYHQLSPSVIAAARRHGVPTVMTLHDYKLAAPCYLLFREGHECTKCVGRRFPLPAVRLRCVQQSRAASLTCAVEQTAHRPLYQRLLDAYVVPSAAARDHFVRSGAVDAQRVHVVSHGVAVTDENVAVEGGRRRVLFFGRLSPEKGVETLVHAWRMAQRSNEWELVLAGDGEDRSRIEEMVSADDDISMVGHQHGEALSQLVDSADVVVVPSLFPETFGLSAAEAMARAKPVLVSDIGNLPALVGEQSLVVTPNDPPAWAAALTWLCDDQAGRRRLGAAARASIVRRFDPAASARATRDVYLAVGAT